MHILLISYLQAINRHPVASSSQLQSISLCILIHGTKRGASQPGSREQGFLLPIEYIKNNCDKFPPKKPSAMYSCDACEEQIQMLSALLPGESTKAQREQS